MNLWKHLLTAFACLLGSAAAVEAQHVFALPDGTTSQTVNVYTASPLSFAGSFTGAPGPSLDTLSNPGGTRYYTVADSATDTLVVADQTFVDVFRSAPYAQNGRAGAVTPDGQRMLVAADTLRIFDTATQTETTPQPALDVGVDPIDVAVSIDSRYAFVLSSTSHRLTRVDLTTNTVAGTIQIPGVSTAVAAGPNGLIYVSAVNQVVDIDGATMTQRGNIPLNGKPRKLYFTPDGMYALATNETVITGTSVWLFDIVDGAVEATIPTLYSGGITPIAMDPKVIVVSNQRAFLTSDVTQTIYDLAFAPGFNIFAYAVTGVGFPSGVTAATASREMPAARFFYYASGGTLHRVDLTIGQLSGTSAIPGDASRLSYAGPSSLVTPSSFIAYNDNQTIAPGEQFLPVVVRALDAFGVPVFNVPVAFASPVDGVTIENASALTNAEGLARATVNPGDVTGPIQVTVTIGVGLLATFNLQVGAVPGDEEGGIAIVSGNGQLVGSQFPSMEPLTVVVRDASGEPEPGKTVSWVITQGQGTLVSTMIETDENGEASTRFLGPTLSPVVGFEQAVITATSGGSSVAFYVTTYPTQFGGTQAPPPHVELRAPALENRFIAGKSGQTLEGAIKVIVVGSVGTHAGSPIPNVRLTTTTGLDPAVGPVASCLGGDAMTGEDGIASCDLVLGGRPGTAVLSTNVGAYRNMPQITVRVDPGDPAIVNIVQGNNQAGDPGQTLPFTLIAQITDVGGTILPGASAQWEVVTPGTVTLSDRIGVAGANGCVSAKATLGSTPGPVLVRVRSGTGVATFTLTVTVNIVGLSMISGDGQTAITNQQFVAPLVVWLEDDKGGGVPGQEIQFAVTSGSAALASPTATTDAQGQASMVVTAGPDPGAIVITAGYGTLTPVTFSLNSRLPGPAVGLTSFTNGASWEPGVVPGSVVNITGPGLAPNVQNCVVPSLLVGALPFTLAEVTVQFGPDSAPMYAPIYHVCNVNGEESVAVQAPVELAPGVTSVTVHVAGGATTVADVPVLAVQPGIFETVGQTGLRYAVLTRSDGSFVSPERPARRGGIICMYATGLGAVTPPAGTNFAGLPGQEVAASLVVAVNGAGVRLVRAEYAVNMIGIHTVYFEIPEDAATGPDRPLALAYVGADGNLVFGNGASIAIE